MLVGVYRRLCMCAATDTRFKITSNCIKSYRSELVSVATGPPV